MMPKTFRCPGYEGHVCERLIKRNHNQKRCPPCAAKELRRTRTAHARERRKVHPEQAACSEYESVRNHHRYIFDSKNPGHRYYKGMPFFDGWNPKKGGSLRAGADWIIANLGKRPKGASLHIIHHDIGFMPGNLEWTYPRKQVNQQMFKIIAQQRHHIRELEEELARVKQAA